MKKTFLTSNMGSCIKINGIKKPSIINSFYINIKKYTGNGISIRIII